MQTLVSKDTARRALITLSLAAILALVGGLLHNPYDVPAYAKGSLVLLENQDIYSLGGVVYPPLLYGIGSFFIAVLEFIGITVTPRNYPAMAVFAGIGAIAHVTIYQLGKEVVADKHQRVWLFATLLNPFAIYVTILFGQMEVFIVLGIVGALYAVRTERWSIGGASLALAAAVKMYPAALFVIYVFYYRDHARKILLGALPIILVTGGLAAIIPNVDAILNPVYGFSDGTTLKLLGVGWSTVYTIFKISFAVSVLVALIAPLPGSIRLMLPLLPVVLVYPDLIEYRWMPFTVAVLAAGYIARDIEPEFRQFFRQSGWVLTAIGTASMIVCTVEGWMEGFEHGAPWLVPSIGTLPRPPLRISLELLGITRHAITYVFAVTVCICILRFVWLAFREDRKGEDSYERTHF